MTGEEQLATEHLAHHATMLETHAKSKRDAVKQGFYDTHRMRQDKLALADTEAEFAEHIRIVLAMVRL